MASTYVNDLRLEEIGDGEQSGTWGATTNTNLELIGEAFSYGTEAITTNADTHSTTIADGATDPGRSMYVKYTGTLDSTCTVSLLPNTISKLWFIENATSGGFNLSIKQGSGAEIVIPNGDVKVVYSDGAGGGAAIFDALVDLNIATKLTVRNPATSASPATLLLQTGDTEVLVDDVLGKIQFQAPDEASGTDAILVSAEIAAVSEGTFTTANNTTKLSFKTAVSEAASEKMSLSSAGNLTVSGTYNGGGLMTTGGNIVIPNAGTIGSASDTDAMAIDANGIITKSAQPAFQAVPASNQNNIPINADTTVVWGTERFDTNADFASNTFTAPVTGKYQLNVELWLQNADTATQYYQLRLKTSNYTYYGTMPASSFTADVGNFVLAINVLADMDASDTAFVTLFTLNSGTAQADINTISTFSGALIA